jgi:hypothetical protein
MGILSCFISNWTLNHDMLQGQVLSDKPPMFGAPPPVPPSPIAAGSQQARTASGAAPSPSTAANTVPDASTGMLMEAHAAKMRSLPLDPGPELLAGLQDWSTTAV